MDGLNWIWVPPPDSNEDRTLNPVANETGMKSIRRGTDPMFTIFVDTEHLLIYTINWIHPDRGKVFAYVHRDLLDDHAGSQ